MSAGQLKRLARKAAAEPEERTEMGNARQLVERHGGFLRYSAAHGWLEWTGQRWRKDEMGGAVERAKDCTRAMLDEARSFLAMAANESLPEDERIKHGTRGSRLMTWAIKSQKRSCLVATLGLAESEPELRVAPGDLDADPFLLNVGNGVLDLRTGRLGPHRREDLITKLAPAEYRPGARSETWERFLRQLTAGDEELEAFLRRMAGYCATGDTREDAIFFIHGRGGSGKSTFIQAITGALGDYATTADFESFIAQERGRGGSAASPDIARLAGARFVPSIEVDDGKRLAEGIVKTLTGGDTVSARFLHKDPFEFKPQFKLALVANHAPRVKAEDDGMWRRIKRIPLDHVVPKGERDLTLRTRLAEPDASSAILAWIVRGCLEWQRDGLAVPTVVEEATAAYRVEMDPFAAFFDAECVFDPSMTVGAGALRDAYTRHAEASGEKPLDTKKLAAALRDRRCEDDRTGARRFWRGVGLRAPEGAR